MDLTTYKYKNSFLGSKLLFGAVDSTSGPREGSATPSKPEFKANYLYKTLCVYGVS